MIRATPSWRFDQVNRLLTNPRSIRFALFHRLWIFLWKEAHEPLILSTGTKIKFRNPQITQGPDERRNQGWKDKGLMKKMMGKGKKEEGKKAEMNCQLDLWHQPSSKVVGHRPASQSLRQPTNHLHSVPLTATDKPQPRATTGEAPYCWKTTQKIPARAIKYIKVTNIGLSVRLAQVVSDHATTSIVLLSRPFIKPRQEPPWERSLVTRKAPETYLSE